MRTVNFYVICYKVFGDREIETDIAFTKEKDAINFIKATPKDKHYYYKHITKKCYTSNEYTR